MSEIDWANTPLEDFLVVSERQADGTYLSRSRPFGDGEAQRIMMEIFSAVQNAYEQLIAPEDDRRYEVEGRVPLIRDGARGFWPLSVLMLKDLPDVLDTLVVLEEEYQQREREESERVAAERKERDRVRAKERRRRKKLGEW